MNLVIVESPAKGRTIERYLGSDYKVVASLGHVRDLPTYKLGVEVNKDFQPEYVIPTKAKKVVGYLKEMGAVADKIYLATDFDREGEAIAWHIVEAIGLNKSQSAKRPSTSLGAGKTQNVRRITFHEVTKEAIQEAIKHPRDIDLNLVNAQQARRILDRLVGYRLSPFLWKKIYKGLSAGRVQSVAVRLIVDREREIENFKPREYWIIVASLLKLKTKNLKLKNGKFEALLVEKDGKKIDKLEIKSEEEAQKIVGELEKADYKVKDIIRKEEFRWPYPPFTTSTLQQEASHKLGFSAKKTMKLAQDLYEEGHITYMRTDSTNLAWLAINSTRKFIEQEFGKKYLPEKARIYKTKIKGAQEAHEAIRPTNIKIQNANIKNQNFSEDHLKLYDLIWRRMLACQMNPAILDVIQIKIQAKNYGFQARGQKIRFAGFSKVWPIKTEEKDLPPMDKGEALDLIKLLKEQHFTEPPARYTEASLVKTLEEKGIGRPSTYAPIISTIQERGYVALAKRVFYPQEIGFIVTDLLTKNFTDIVDIDFTKSMEENLDQIAEGKKSWVEVLQDFYRPFEENLNKKYQEVSKGDIMQEETKEICPKCQKPMVVRLGRFGKFLACSGFPNCKTTKPIIVKTGQSCPKCEKGEIIEKRTKKGKIFWGCSSYPDCDWASWENPQRLNESN